MTNTLAVSTGRPALRDVVSGSSAAWPLRIVGNLEFGSLTGVYVVFGQSASAPVHYSDLDNASYYPYDDFDQFSWTPLGGGQWRINLSYQNFTLGSGAGGDPGWLAIVQSSATPTGTDSLFAVTGPFEVV